MQKNTALLVGEWLFHAVCKQANGAGAHENEAEEADEELAALASLPKPKQKKKKSKKVSYQHGHSRPMILLCHVLLVMQSSSRFLVPHVACSL